jgi:hypothetical protein
MGWEYLTTTVKRSGLDYLQMYGHEGWELVAVISPPNDDAGVTFYFKRPVRIEPHRGTGL